jgi:hypothetical protein
LGRTGGAALLRPDRFRAVIALSVPSRRRSPVVPTSVMPQSDNAIFYQLYFQEPGVAEAELERDVRQTFLKVQLFVKRAFCRHRGVKRFRRVSRRNRSAGFGNFPSVNYPTLLDRFLSDAAEGRRWDGSPSNHCADPASAGPSLVATAEEGAPRRPVAGRSGPVPRRGRPT